MTSHTYHVPYKQTTHLDYVIKVVGATICLAPPRALTLSVATPRAATTLYTLTSVPIIVCLYAPPPPHFAVLTTPCSALHVTYV